MAVLTMRMAALRYTILGASALGLAVGVVYHPAALANNAFLQDFISANLIEPLVVILTITFASVANIHLSLNRIAAGLAPERRSKIDDIRTDINKSAWWIFWAFIVCAAALLLKGAFPAQEVVVASVHAFALLVLLLNALVMHTIYRAIFALVAAEDVVKGSVDAERQNFADESPPAGRA